MLRWSPNWGAPWQAHFVHDDTFLWYIQFRLFAALLVIKMIYTEGPFLLLFPVAFHSDPVNPLALSRHTKSIISFINGIHIEMQPADWWSPWRSFVKLRCPVGNGFRPMAVYERHNESSPPIFRWFRSCDNFFGPPTLTKLDLRRSSFFCVSGRVSMRSDPHFL